MALQAPINWPEIQQALHAWFTGVTGLLTVWANQNTPDKFPHAVLNISGPTKIGGSDEVRYRTDVTKPEGEEIGIEVVGLREISCSCQVVVKEPDSADPTKDPRHHLSIAQSSIGLPAVLQAFSTAGLAVISAGGIDVVNERDDGTSIARGNLDVRFGLSSYLEERTGFIKRVEISSTGLGGSDLTEEVFGDKS